MYKIIATQSFLKSKFKYFDKEELSKFTKFIDKLKTNPYLGDTIRVNYVREFKSKKGKRAYFIVYDEYNLILFVLLSNKKNQEKVIEKLFSNLSYYKKIAKSYNS